MADHPLDAAELIMVRQMAAADWTRDPDTLAAYAAEVMPRMADKIEELRRQLYRTANRLRELRAQMSECDQDTAAAYVELAGFLESGEHRG